MSLSGLYPFEVVLLVLGAVFFLTLLIILVFLVKEGKPFGKLSVFFVISLVMMGYPGIVSIQYGELVVTMNQKTQELQKDPNNPALKEALASVVQRVVPRATTPTTQFDIAKAQAALGQLAAAKVTLEKIPSTAPQFLQARELKKEIESGSIPRR
jgi:hypothetical protein